MSLAYGILNALRRARRIAGKHGPVAGLRMAVHYVGAVFRARDPQLANTARTFNDFFFSELGVSREQAFACYRDILARLDVSKLKHSTIFTEIGQSGSIHHILFAAMKLSGFQPKTIFEVGTYLGDTAEYLSELFPEATIYTVDLPASDPLVADFFNPAEREAIAGRLASRSNIVTLETNTLFLPKFNLPDFDLVWMDGGMFFPDIAWEHFYFLNKLNPGGWLMIDDVHIPEDPLTRIEPRYLNMIDTQRYIDARSPSKFRYLLKDESAKTFAANPKRVAVYRAP